MENIYGEEGSDEEFAVLGLWGDLDTPGGRIELKKYGMVSLVNTFFEERIIQAQKFSGNKPRCKSRNKELYRKLNKNREEKIIKLFCNILRSF